MPTPRTTARPSMASGENRFDMMAAQEPTTTPNNRRVFSHMDQFPLDERPLVSKYAATPDLTSRANAAASRLGKATVVASISDIGVAHTDEINSILTTVPSREIGVNWQVAPWH